MTGLFLLSSALLSSLLLLKVGLMAPISLVAVILDSIEVVSCPAFHVSTDVEDWDSPLRMASE